MDVKTLSDWIKSLGTGIVTLSADNSELKFDFGSPTSNFKIGYAQEHVELFDNIVEYVSRGGIIKVMKFRDETISIKVKGKKKKQRIPEQDMYMFRGSFGEFVPVKTDELKQMYGVSMFGTQKELAQGLHFCQYEE